MELQKSDVLFRPCVISGHPSVVEMLGFLGFDWAFIDAEQAAPSPSERHNTEQ